MTAHVYILFSPSLDGFYTGFTKISVQERLNRHNEKYYYNKYTAKASDWEIYLSIECITEKQGRSIESHIKKMKSKTYILNLKRYPNIVQELLKRYEIK
jgi:putative endonuclease